MTIAARGAIEMIEASTAITSGNTNMLGFKVLPHDWTGIVADDMPPAYIWLYSRALLFIAWSGNAPIL